MARPTDTRWTSGCLANDIAAPLLESVRLSQEPPSIVRETQDVISWLSRAVIELDEDSSDGPAALADTLARLLIVWVFADVAQEQPD